MYKDSMDKHDFTFQRIGLHTVLALLQKTNNNDHKGVVVAINFRLVPTTSYG